VDVREDVVSEQETGPLRRAVARLIDAQEEASDAAKRGLEQGRETSDYEDSWEVNTHLEDALIDVLDILEGASTDVHGILGDVAEELGKGEA
jgi:hypothetical protein